METSVNEDPIAESPIESKHGEEGFGTYARPVRTLTQITVNSTDADGNY